MRTRVPMLLLCVVTLVITLGVAPPTCNAGPITVVYAEQIDSFNLIITSAGFNANDNHVLTLSSGQWLVNLTITEQAGGAADMLTINGTARHIVGPHGEGPNGAGFAINFNVNAAAFPLGLNALPALGGTIDHGQHSDVFAAALIFTTAVGAGTVDITSYTFALNGVHTPEPATLLLLGSGLAGICAAVRRRRKLDRQL